MKYSFKVCNIIIISTILILLYIAGCGGGSSTGVTPSVPTTVAENPTATPVPAEVSVTGTVMDNSSQPISGALVALYAYDSVTHLNTSASPSQTTITNSLGEYTFNNVPSGNCRIEAWRSEQDYFNNPSSPMAAVNLNTNDTSGPVVVTEGGVDPTPVPTATPTPKPEEPTPTPPAETPTTVPTPDGGTYDWTYMVYMGADNNLADYGLEDINEMELGGGSSSQISVVVQAEFDPSYTSSPDITDRSALRLQVLQDSSSSSPDLSRAVNLGNIDMTSSSALTDFINWTKTNYPAEHYVLVFWDHGAGWREATGSPVRGAITDSTGDIMELPVLSKGVSDSGVHFDVICFDACIMAMYEVAYEFKGLTDYMVFSEDNEPGPGYPYDTIIPVLISNPSITGENLAIETVNKYDASYPSYYTTTQSAIDMSQVETLNTKVRALAALLTADTGTFTTVEAGANSAYDYGYNDYHDLYEVCNYLETNLSNGSAATAAGEVKNFMSTIVIANKTNGTYPSNASKGLAIYLPLPSQTTSSTLNSAYGPLDCNVPATSSWYEFLLTWYEL